jgi:hypothetical protein
MVISDEDSSLLNVALHDLSIPSLGPRSANLGLAALSRPLK